MQSFFRRQVLLLSALAAGAAVCCGSAIAAAPIAGLASHQRPEGAPVVSKAKHELGWWLAALHGVDKPVPASLAWLKDQGAWYTPFNHPGMPGSYDLRGWHRPAASALPAVRSKDAGR